MIGWLCRGLKHRGGRVRVGCLDSNHWGPALRPGHLRLITERYKSLVFVRKRERRTHNTGSDGDVKWQVTAQVKSETLCVPSLIIAVLALLQDIKDL